VLNRVLNSYFLLGLIRRIDLLLEETRLKENSIRISEFNQLISKLIQTENTPFIYERIGTRFSNYLLDEFQDTSRMQWLNLIPLLEDSLGNGNTNFVVGDSKQAIYRFRNGLVAQFAALPKIYNPENWPHLSQISAQFEALSDVQAMDNNYRSKKEVVEFNNRLFQLLRVNLNNYHQTFYKDEDLIQHPIKKNGGYVELHQTEDPEKYVLQTVKNCLENGFQSHEICLLFNQNEETSKWAKMLMENGYEVVSDVALRVDTSLQVRLLINFMRYRQSKQLSKQILFIASYYHHLGKENLFELIRPFMEKNERLPINAFS
jgi:ATP-dependent exoDNAse (exonuclease V) beta subunit